MPKLKLIYFDFHGGRGEPARLALSMRGIPFEDDRVSPSDWERRKPNTPFGGLPVLEVDGQTLAQSNAINRYVGKITDLYPTDAWQAAFCDEAMEAVRHQHQACCDLFSSRTGKESAAQSAGRRTTPFLSWEATAAARSTWRSLRRGGPSNSRGPQGIRMDPAP